MASSLTAEFHRRMHLSFAPAFPREGTGRIDYLDGWRAIAVALVVTAHTLSVYGIKLLAVGTLGVYLFFGISGYIITRLLLLERHRTGRIDIGAFYIRRIARIFPPLVIFLSAMVALWPDGSLLGQALRSAAFTCNIGVNNGCVRILEHTWSLAFEEQFYLVYPLLLAGVWRWWLIPLAAFWLLPLVFPVGYIGHGGFARIILIMAFGAIFAAYEKPVTVRIVRLPASLVAIMPMLLAGWALLDPSPLQIVLGALLPLAAVLTVFGLPLVIPRFKQLLCTDVLTRIGLYSYTFYLWQQFFTYPWAWNTGVMPIVGIGAALLLAAVSYHTVERLCRRWAQAVTARRKRPRTGPSS